MLAHRFIIPRTYTTTQTQAQLTAQTNTDETKIYFLSKVCCELFVNNDSIMQSFFIFFKIDIK